MKLFRAIIIFTCLVVNAGTVLADTLLIDLVEKGTSVQRPERGSSMEQVLANYGKPEHKSTPVGKPPITRWDYPKFSVYFENDHVIHSVVKRK